MAISSVASTSSQTIFNNLVTGEDRIEGNKPDGDGDRDYAVRVPAAKPTSTALSKTGSLGRQIDVVA